MTLEQRLEDPVFRENTFTRTIEDTIMFARLVCKVREQSGVNDGQYQSAKSFVTDYNKCKLYGANPEFMRDLFAHMMAEKTGRVVRKALPRLLIVAAGAGIAYAGYSSGNSLLGSLAAGLSMGVLVGTFGYMPNAEAQRTVIIYQAMEKHPDVVNDALKRLYEKEKKCLN